MQFYFFTKIIDLSILLLNYQYGDFDIENGERTREVTKSVVCRIHERKWIQRERRELRE
jgi:hypothetical protein